MAPFLTATAQPVLRHLAWDSNHFDLSIAEITRPFLPLSELSAALQLARRRGTHLVCWSARPDLLVPPGLLDQYAGLLAARQVTFRRALAEQVDNADHPLKWLIRPYPRGRAERALVELAVAAGVCSRFQTDAWLPAGGFASLYEKWIQRSTRHEIADVVLVATPLDDREEIVGMVTLSQVRCTAHVGLLAVANRTRRQGLGSVLLEAARRWMLEGGAGEAQVVTQLTNQAACALYRKAGYHANDVKHIYHFWTHSWPRIYRSSFPFIGQPRRCAS